jgi:hypothetical protein
MSKLALIVSVPVVAGLVVWNLSLSSDVEDLRAQLASTREPAPAESGKTAADAAKAPSVPRAVQQEMTGLATRLAEVEKRLPATPATPAPSEGGVAPSAAAPVPTAAEWDAAASAQGYQSEAFKGAVARVLEEREENRRRERADRQAETIARFLLRDLTVTDQQRADVRRLVAQSMEKVEKIREDETLTDEQRREQIQTAQQERVESLSAVLDAQQMETVRQRSQQTRARPGGVRGPGGGPGGPGRTNPGGSGGTRGQ